MKPVTQTRTGFPAGNCTEAVLASLLEVDLEEVPDLFDPDADPSQKGWRDHRFAELHRWLHSLGLMYCQVFADPESALIFAADTFGSDVADAHYFVGGYNPDGVPHACVGLGGEVVWDPNPLRRGITGADEVVFLVPLDLIPEEYRDRPGLSWTLGAAP